ncbi:hypothetical protein PG999_003689 [Apiospora kogelbergensis]|uniref:Uncharacterized protein n=1 Tax=Apiospora kogelbergensis TaxID=1337665 RepID=A0AAW0R4D3_9PEZI
MGAVCTRQYWLRSYMRPPRSAVAEKPYALAEKPYALAEKPYALAEKLYTLAEKRYVLAEKHARQEVRSLRLNSGAHAFPDVGFEIVEIGSKSGAEVDV